MQFEKQEYQENCVANILKILKKIDIDDLNGDALQEAIKEHYKENDYSKLTL